MQLLLSIVLIWISILQQILILSKLHKLVTLKICELSDNDVNLIFPHN